MNFENILLSQKSSLLTITINREPKLNALNRATLSEISNAVTQALNDDGIRGIILTGAGGKAFAAGADISELKNLDQIEGKKLAQEGHSKVFDLIENSIKPVIAAINGFALGGGLELALACHIRIASESAKMGLPELTLGLIPGYGGTQRLAQLVGKGKAMELILSSESITAAEASKLGLVNHVTSAEALLETAEELLYKIIKNPPLAIAAAIKSINASTTKEGFALEIEEFANRFGTEEFTEGVTAFLEKRKPSF